MSNGLVNQPTLAEVKAWLGITTDTSDAVIDEAYQSALEAQQDLRFPSNSQGRYYPHQLRQALLLRVRRLVARRDSPVGVLGFGDYGAVNVGSSDPDVTRLEAPYKDIGPW